MKGMIAGLLMENVAKVEEEQQEQTSDNMSSFITSKANLAPVVNQTKVIHKVHTVAKFDTVHYKTMKRMCMEFVAAGKAELLQQ